MDRFVYTSGIEQPLQAPIRSNLSDLIREAKQKNDSTYWSSMRKVFEEDFKTLPLDRFKAWESTLSVPIMVRGRLHYYMGRSLSLAYKDSEWYKAIEEPMVGMSEQDYYQLFSLCDDYRTTMNRVQQAAHLITCGFSKQDIRSFKSIVELGAGVGAACVANGGGACATCCGTKLLKLGNDGVSTPFIFSCVLPCAVIPNTTPIAM